MADDTESPSAVDVQQTAPGPVDISNQMSLATSEPKEAVKNIDNSEIYGMNPSDYKGLSKDLDPHADQLLSPKSTTPVVADGMAKSTEHAALMKPDNDNLSWIEKQSQMIGDYIHDRPNTQNQIIALSLKKRAQGGDLSPEDEVKLYDLNEKMTDLDRKDYGLNGPLNQLPAEIMGAGRSLVDMAAKAADFANKVPAIGPVGKVGALFVGGMKQASDELGGAIYNQMSNSKNEAGQPYSESTKQVFSRGAGIVGGEIQGLLQAGSLNASPIVSSLLNPALAATIVDNPASAALLKTVMTIGAQYGEGFVGGAAIKTTQALSEDVAKYYDGTEESILNGLNAFAAKGSGRGNEIARAANEMGLTQGALAVLHGAVGFPATMSKFAKAAETIKEARFAGARDVTPTTPPSLPPGGEPPAPPSAPTATLPPGGEPPSGPSLPPGDNPVVQATKTLYFNEALTNIAKVADQTGMAKIAGPHLTQLMGEIFEKYGIGKIWVVPRDIKNKFSDPSHVQSIMAQVDPTGQTADNTPIGVPTQKWLEVAKEFPDIRDVERLGPNEPEPLKAKEYLQRLEDAQQLRAKVHTDLGLDDLPSGTSPINPAYQTKAIINGDLSKLKTKQAVINHLDTITRAMLPITGTKELPDHGIDWHSDSLMHKDEEDYMNADVFRSIPEGVISETDKKQFRASHIKAKQAVAAALREVDRTQVEKVQNVVREAFMDQKRKEVADRLANDPNIALVEKFRGNAVVKEGQGKKPRSIYAIDRNKLSDAQIQVGLTPDNLLLKEHGVFAPKGEEGLSPDEAAQMLGEPHGDVLLAKLASTPTRAQIQKAQTEAYRPLADSLAETIGSDPKNLEKAFNDLTNTALAELDFMLSKKWPTVAGLMKRAAFSRPKIEELRWKAKEAIGEMNSEDVDPKQFEVGERRSRMAAHDAFAKGHWERGFQNLANAALNIELRKEAMWAIAQMNRGFTWVRRIQDPHFMERIEKAPPIIGKAFHEIVGVFQLDENVKQIPDELRGSYAKFVKKMTDEGRGNFPINPSLADIRQGYGKTKVKVLLEVFQRLKALNHEAIIHDKILSESVKEAKEQKAIGIEALVKEFHDLIVKHPDYDPNRSLIHEKTAPPMSKIQALVEKAVGSANTFVHALNQLDEEKPGGRWFEEYAHRIYGLGKFYEKAGASGAKKDMLELVKWQQPHIEEFNKAAKRLGTPLFHQLESDIVNIPEFKDITAWNKGRLSRMDLMVLWAHGGDPAGFKNRSENVGLTDDVIQKVLDRELKEHHITATQNMLIEGKKNYRPRVAQMHKRTTGQDVTWIEGKGNVWKDKVTPGGYVRQIYKTDYAQAVKAMEDAERKRMDAATGDKTGAMYGQPYAGDMTEQGYLEERTGSGKPLDLDWYRQMRTYEEVIHDLNHREIGIDLYNLLQHPQHIQDMMSVIGKTGYGLIENTVRETVGQMELENANYFNDTRRWINAIATASRSAEAISTLAFSASTMFIHLNSVPFFLQKMGRNGIKHWLGALKLIITNPHHISGLYDFAASIDDTIKDHLTEVNNNLISGTRHLVGERSLLPHGKLSKGLAILGKGRDFMHRWGMSGIVFMDTATLKMPFTVGSYMQFLAGDGPKTKEELLKMTPEEIVSQGRAYAKQISLSVGSHFSRPDKAPIQKIAEIFTQYWNILRQQFNNYLSMNRRMKWSAKGLRDSLGEGGGGYRRGADEGFGPGAEGVNFEDAGKNSKALASSMMVMLLTSIVARLYHDKVKGRPSPLDHQLDASTDEGKKRALKMWGDYLLTSPFENFLDATPVVSSLKYAALDKHTRGKFKDVEFPFLHQMSNVATSVSAINNWLEYERLPNKEEKKAMLYSLGYMVGGLPVNGAYKFGKFLDAEKKAFQTPGLNAEFQKQFEEIQGDKPKDVSEEDMKGLEKLNEALNGPKPNSKLMESKTLAQ